MIEAELWSEGVKFLHLDHISIQKCKKYLTWGENEHILDIGAGEGHTTFTTIMPLIPSFQKFTLIDINSGMIELLKKKINDPRISTELGNVLCTKLVSKHAGTFTHVFCMLILHWLQDKQRLGLENIFKMLKPGGELVVSCIIDTAIYDAVLAMAKEPKWLKYTQKVPEYISFYKTCEDPLQKFQDTITEVGFETVFIERAVPSACRFPAGIFNKFVTSLYPDVGLVPDHLREEFTNCYLEKFKATDMVEYFYDKDGNATEVDLTYKQMYAVVKKPFRSSSQ